VPTPLEEGGGFWHVMGFSVWGRFVLVWGWRIPLQYRSEVLKERCLLFYKGWICSTGKPFPLIIFIILKAFQKYIPYMNTTY
jgi:hypothetical protein